MALAAPLEHQGPDSASRMDAAAFEPSLGGPFGSVMTMPARAARWAKLDE